MTKENREKQYKHFRKLEATYEPVNPKLNSGLTSIKRLRQHAKEMADAMLIRNPELEQPVVEEVKEKPKSKEKK